MLVSVSQFVYLKGNFALDMGSQETVTIRTGIPSSIGSLAGSAVDAVNAALSNLSTTLDDLKSDVQDAIASALQSIQAKINAQVNSIVDTIFANLTSTLEEAVGAVSSSLTTQLEAATAGVSQSIDGAIDAALAPITANIPAPLDELVKLLLVPIKEVIRKTIGDAVQEALVGSVDKIASSVSSAISAGLQGTEQQVKAKIHSILDPQILRVITKLNQLISKIDAKIEPAFTQLQSLANIHIGEDFATIDDVKVNVTAIGISDATAFVGMPPAGGFDFSKSIAEQNAIGLFIQNLNMALGFFKPVVGKQLPNFTALKLTADSAGFTDGGAGILEHGRARHHGRPQPRREARAGHSLRDRRDDRFPGELQGRRRLCPAGYPVATGTTTEPIYLDFAGELIRASVAWAEITISEFVHIAGSFAFEKGPIATVDVTGGLLTGAASDYLDQLNLPDGISIPATGADTTQLSFMTIGAVGRARVHRHERPVLDRPRWRPPDFVDRCKRKHADGSRGGREP